ncbi:MAG: mercuric reductase [Sphingobacteriaceae bacterium]
MKKYDAIIIGSGQAGTPLAKRLARAGYKTALVEKRLIGGTCINDGCTPTKTIIASARMAYLANHSKEWGINVSDVKVDFPAVMRRKDTVVASFRGGAAKGLEKTPRLDIIFGEASFSDDKTLLINLNDGGTQTLTADQIFIDVGLEAKVPEIDGLADAGYLTSTSILELTELPKHLLILGASAVGLEFGQMFRRLGSDVTILEQGKRFLPHEDQDVAAGIAAIFQADGIDLLIGANTEAITRKDKMIIAKINSGGQQKMISCSHILVAVGRIPKTAVLNLKTTSIKTDKKGHIIVNNKLETNIEGVYALGDVKGGPAFTHIAYNDFLIVAGNLLQGKKLTTDGRMLPYCIFMDPPLARVGITEAEARKQKLKIKIAKLPMKNVGRAVETGEVRGFMKAIVDADNGKILGVSILGAEGGEVMSVLQMAMMGGISYDVIRNSIFAHPTYSESLNNLFMTLDDQ